MANGTVKSTDWISIVEEIIQILQSTGMLQVLIDVITQIIAAISGGATTQGQLLPAVQKQLPALLKLYAKLPADKQALVDEIILKA
jgi:hypothetical protein